MGAIYIHATRLLARSQGPRFQNRQCLRIELQECVAVLHVQEDVTGIIGGGVLVLPPRFSIAPGDFAGLGIDRADLLAAAVDV